MKTIRLSSQIRVGIDLIPSNAVVDAVDQVADALIAAGKAALSTAVERYPDPTTIPAVAKVEVDVKGSDPAPLPAGDPRILTIVYV